MAFDFFSTVGGQRFVGKTETNLTRIAKSLDEIAEQMKEANRLKSFELGLIDKQIDKTED